MTSLQMLSPVPAAPSGAVAEALAGGRYPLPAARPAPATFPTLPELPPPPQSDRPRPDDARQHAPSTVRNRDVIAAVLREVLPARGTVLEVAAGSGEHACSLAAAFPGLDWQPTDPSAAALASIDAWGACCRQAGLALPNLKPARALDVTMTPWLLFRASALVCINMIHISPWEATEGLMSGAEEVLPVGGVLFTYGPYRIDGQQTSDSNAKFETWLKGRDSRFGIRDMAGVAALAARHHLLLEQVIAMPANNFSLVFRKTARTA